MKSCFKMILVGIGVVLVLCGLGVVVAFGQLERTLKTGIEQTVSHVYDAQTAVDDVAVSLSAGTIDIRGLTVFNCVPFDPEPAMRFGRVLVRLDLKSLLTEKTTIHEIVVSDAHITLQHRLRAGTNLGKLSDNAAKSKPSGNGKAPYGAKRTFVVEELRVEDARILASTALIPFSSVEIEAPPIVLTDISQDKAVGMGELASLFVRALLTKGITLKGALKPLEERIHQEMEGWGAGDDGAQEPPDTEQTTRRAPSYLPLLRVDPSSPVA